MLDPMYLNDDERRLIQELRELRTRARPERLSVFTVLVLADRLQFASAKASPPLPGVDMRSRPK